MPSQRVTIGIGLAILLVISAASIGLDLKSQTDAAAVNQTLGVLKQIPDLELLLRRTESAARGFALNKAPPTSSSSTARPAREFRRRSTR